MTADRPASPSVDRTLTVLEALVAAGDGLTLSGLSRATRIPLATTASIAYTLEQRGYAARRVVGRSHFWRATVQLYELAAPLATEARSSPTAQ